LAQNITTKEIAGLVLDGLYSFGAYFAGTYVAANAERFSGLIKVGDRTRRWIVKFLRLIGLYLIVSATISIAMGIIFLIVMAYYLVSH
jgi:hypothetical protein